MIDWAQFLRQWSAQLLQSDLAKRMSSPSESKEWLGYAGATEAEVSGLEKRLGVPLPPSYKTFLTTTNGWRRTTPFISNIRPVSSVNWFRVDNQSWIDACSLGESKRISAKYFDYDKQSEDFRTSHLKNTLQISDVDDGVYLLNPDAVTPDGEWEAWLFATWIPGARRFPSFSHLMLAEYISFCSLAGVKPIASLPSLPMPAPKVPRKRLKPSRRPDVASVEELIGLMRNGASEEQSKAVHAFVQRLELRKFSTRNSALTRDLNQLYYSSDNSDVRAACIKGITQYADDGEAPSSLFDSLSDPDDGVVVSGIWALGYFPDDRSIEPLCGFMERHRSVIGETAILALAEAADKRAIPALTRVLFDTSNTFDQRFATAAYALAKCRAFDDLAAAALHEDARVRLAAVVGLDEMKDPRGKPLIDRLQHDPDESVRTRAGYCNV